MTNYSTNRYMARRAFNAAAANIAKRYCREGVECRTVSVSDFPYLVGADETGWRTANINYTDAGFRIYGHLCMTSHRSGRTELDLMVLISDPRDLEVGAPYCIKYTRLAEMREVLSDAVLDIVRPMVNSTDGRISIDSFTPMAPNDCFTVTPDREGCIIGGQMRMFLHYEIKEA